MGGAGGEPSAGAAGTTSAGAAGSPTAGTGGTTTAGAGGAAGSGTAGASAGSVGAGAGGKSGSGGACAGVTTKTTPKTLPVDVILAVDNSGSMINEINFIQQKLNAFSSAIVASGIDMHVVLVSGQYTCLFGNCNPPFQTGMCLPAPLGSGNCPADTNPPNYTHAYAFVDSTDGLLVLKSSFPKWKGALRPDAKKTIVIVTDDDATMAPYDAVSFPNAEVGAAAKFISDFTALDPVLLKDWKMAGIYSYSMCPSAAAEGKVWREIIKQTGGIQGDLCKQDFQPILDELQKAVVVGTQIPCQWKIPAPPPGLMFDPAQVNVVYTDGGNQQNTVPFAKNAAGCSVSQGGWYFDNDAAPTTVLACPATCGTIKNDPMASVAVTFGCERIGFKN